jgi:hypothetical protein
MKLEEIIELIETKSTKILQAEYKDDKAYLTVDEVAFSFIDGLYYTLLLNCGTSNRSVDFVVDSIVGLPTSFLDFNEQDVSTFTVVVVNIALKMLEIDDDLRICEDFQLYYFNDDMELHYEYEADIDLG